GAAAGGAGVPGEVLIVGGTTRAGGRVCVCGRIGLRSAKPGGGPMAGAARPPGAPGPPAGTGAEPPGGVGADWTAARAAARAASSAGSRAGATAGAATAGAGAAGAAAAGAAAAGGAAAGAGAPLLSQSRI